MPGLDGVSRYRKGYRQLPTSRECAPLLLFLPANLVEEHLLAQSKPASDPLTRFRWESPPWHEVEGMARVTSNRPAVFVIVHRSELGGKFIEVSRF